mmetsp:Transcript_22998/g.57574  ORF Transcript_22998/g.57574 Transcript_22998/m.57574 type:complete len:714 (-) Transcript_22998:189-2330(-)
MKYSFGVTRGSTFDPAAAVWSATSSSSSFNAYLAQGQFRFAGRVHDALGRTSVGTATRVDVTARVAARRYMSTDEEDFQHKQGLITGLSNLGQDGQLFQVSGTMLESLATDVVNTTSRRLLASSAAYRMRQRRLIASKLSSTASGHSMTPSAASVGLSGGLALTSVPQEITTGTASDAATLLDSSSQSATPETSEAGGLVDVVNAGAELVTYSGTVENPDVRQSIVSSTIRAVTRLASARLRNMIPEEKAYCLDPPGMKVELKCSGIDAMDVWQTCTASQFSPLVVHVGQSETSANALASVGPGIMTFRMPSEWGLQAAARSVEIQSVSFAVDPGQPDPCEGSSLDLPCLKVVHNVSLEGLNSTAIENFRNGRGVKCMSWNALFESDGWTDNICNVTAIDVSHANATNAFVSCECSGSGVFTGVFEHPEWQEPVMPELYQCFSKSVSGGAVGWSWTYGIFVLGFVLTFGAVWCFIFFLRVSMHTERPDVKSWAVKYVVGRVEHPGGTMDHSKGFTAVTHDPDTFRDTQIATLEHHSENIYASDLAAGGMNVDTANHQQLDQNALRVIQSAPLPLPQTASGRRIPLYTGNGESLHLSGASSSMPPNENVTGTPRQSSVSISERRRSSITRTRSNEGVDRCGSSEEKPSTSRHTRGRRLGFWDKFVAGVFLMYARFVLPAEVGKQTVYTFARNIGKRSILRNWHIRFLNFLQGKR